MMGQRLTLMRVYLDDRENGEHGALSHELFDRALSENLAGGTLLRAWAGAGRSGIVRAPYGEVNWDHLPLVAQFVDVDDTIHAFRDAHVDILDGLLTTLEPVWLVHRHKGRDLPDPLERVPENGRPKLLRMFCNEDDTTYQGANAVEHVVGILHPICTCVFAIRGLEGFGSHRKLHRDRLFHHERSMPVMISAICQEADLDKVLHEAITGFPRLSATVESVTLWDEA